MPAPPNIAAHKPHFHRNEAWKQPVRCATAAAGTLASSFENGDTAGGVTLATGDRILIKDQAAAEENGIYVVAASGAPDRAYDMDVDDECVGAHVYVIEGTNGGTTWRCSNTTAPELDVDDVTWESAGAATALADLTDVDLTGLGDGDFISYDTGSATWLPVGAPSGTVPDGTDPGDLLAWDGAAWDVVAVGANDAVLTADDGEALGVKWAAGAGGSWGISASKYHPDNETPATTPDVQEELNGAFVGSWAWDATDPGTVDFSTYPGYYHVINDGTDRYLSCAWTPGATDVTIACKVSAVASSSSTPTLMVGAANSTGTPTDGLFATIFPKRKENAAATFMMYSRTSSSFTAVGSEKEFAIGPTASWYIRLVRVVSGPTWTFYISNDGITWVAFGTTSNKSLTVGAVAIRVADNACTYTFDWIRAWDSVVTAVGA